MADIINFQAYVNAKDEEKARIRMISALSTRRDNTSGLLSAIEDSISVSLAINYFGELNQIVRSERLIENDLLDIIIAAIKQYRDGIQHEISKLEAVDTVI